MGQPVEYYRVYLRSILDGHKTTTVITRNLLSVNERDNPSDVRKAAEARMGSGWSAYHHHRIRHDQAYRRK